MLYSCPFCSHEDATIYRPNEALREGGSRDIYECNECQTLYSRPRMTDQETISYIINADTNKELAQYYDPVKKDNAKGVARMAKKIILSLACPHDLTKILLKWVQPKGLALDIGTYTGQFCHTLNSLGFDAYGLEPQDTAANFARKRGLNVLTGYFPDNIPSKLPTKEFDLISTLDCIYYFVDLKKSLLKVNEMLSQDGFFLIQCLQGESGYFRTQGNSYFKRYGDDVQGIPTLASLEYILEKTGFEIVDVGGVPLYPFDLSACHSNSLLRKAMLPLEIAIRQFYQLTLFDKSKADKLIVLARKKWRAQ